MLPPMEANPNSAPAPTAKSKRGHLLCQRWSTMVSNMEPWKVWWQEIADMMMPRKAGISSKSYTPEVSKEAKLFDTTANDALMTMAGGLMTWTTPANEPWFGFQPAFRMRKFDAVKQWLAECSTRTLEVLANSTFYTERHEDLLNHCSFGLSAMYCAIEDGRLRFESLPVGTFCIEENAFGEVDTLFRELPLNARQAAQMFGLANLSQRIQDAFKENKDTTFHFIHAVYPRPEDERPSGVARKADWGKAWASCYVDCTDKVVVKESGYDSFPFSVGRYLKWSALGCKTPYGYGPGWAALPDVRQVNFLQMMMDVAAEKIVRPSMMAPEEMERSLILSPGGITYMPQNIAEERWPKPIAQVGDYSVGVDRVKMRQDSIQAKFHFQLFNLFASLDRPQMTAYEVAARESEKITLISPAFSRLISEKDKPMLRRLFELCALAGVYDPPPAEAVEQTSKFSVTVPPPDVDFTSRLALTVKQLANVGFERQLQGDLAIAQFDPSIMDNYDFDRITRDRARNNNVPAGWMRDEKARDAIRQQRAQAQALQAGIMAAKDGASAVKDLGGVDALQQLAG